MTQTARYPHRFYRWVAVLAPILVLLALAHVGLSFAGAGNREEALAAPLQPTDDAYTSILSPTIPYGVADPQYLVVQASRSPVGPCNTTKYTWLQFDLAALGGNTTTATLRLANPQYTGPGAGVRLGLFAVTEDNWDESTLTGNTHPVTSIISPALVLATPPPFGQPHLDLSSAALVNYVNSQQSGDRLASLAVAYVECPTVSAPQFRVSSKEGLAAPLLLLDVPYRLFLPLVLSQP
jgi:hypothetical protein